MSYILLGYPTYNHQAYFGSVATIQQAVLPGQGHTMIVRNGNNSILPHCFNMLWCRALNGTFDYFAMLHADVMPDPGWLTLLLDELNRVDADVVSAVIPIKDGTNLVSMGIGKTEDGRGKMVKQFTLDQCPKEATFNFDSLPGDLRSLGDYLMINTGCWVCRMKRDWNTKVWFEVETWTECIDGLWKCGVLSEDWRFSEMLHQQGCSVYATTKLKLGHIGSHVWNN